MRQGKDYIIFPLDVASDQAARQMVRNLYTHIGMFKVGLELFIRTGPDLLRWIGDHTGSRVFFDLKLHDIPATVERAMRGIADLPVALATVHCGENRVMLEAAVSGAAGKVGVLGVTVLTSVGASDLRDAGFGEAMAGDVSRLVMHRAAMAKAAGCAGVICSGREAGLIKSRMGPAFMAVTPGIRPEKGMAPDDQKRVVTPARAISDGADYLVIGRPIRDAADPAVAADRIADEIDQVLALRNR
jgi:orotidine-5'-phosphate decarboxylase